MWSEEDQAYIGHVAELVSLAAHGASPALALREMIEVVECVLEAGHRTHDAGAVCGFIVLCMQSASTALGHRTFREAWRHFWCYGMMEPNCWSGVIPGVSILTPDYSATAHVSMAMPSKRTVQTACLVDRWASDGAARRCLLPVLYAVGDDDRRSYCQHRTRRTLLP